MILEYVEQKYGFKEYATYIVEVKRELGLSMRDVHNATGGVKREVAKADRSGRGCPEIYKVIL